MKHHTHIINHYIRKIKAKSYLEIGVHPTRANFDRVECADKTGVDPDLQVKGIDFNIPSDAFFSQNTKEFSLIFLDGLHHADQLETDICNASRCLSRNGVIICHDSNPIKEEHARIPRNGEKIWNGNVWRTIVGFRQKYPLIRCYTYKDDHGITVIHPRGATFDAPFVSDISFGDFMRNKRKLLGLI